MNTRSAPAVRHSFLERRYLGSVKRIAISAFLLFHIVAIVCWCVPLDSPLIAAFRGAIRPYFQWAGLFQGWDMFAPTPKSANSYIDAAILYRDGHTKTWQFPRMEQRSLAERYRKERYRKFTENLQKDANAPLLPDTARHIARLNNDGANPPEFVILVRHWSDIVPASHGAELWRTQILYSYSVQPKDLK